MTDTIQIDITGNIATLTMNRPKLFNALNLEMAQALAEGCLQIQNEPGVRCLVIKGSGGNFLAGGDISSFKTALDEKNETYINGLIHYANLAAFRIREMAIPVLASVEGAAAGYGLSLMLACDLAIATENAKFVSAYSLIGASPDGGMTFHLPRFVGEKKAFELIALSNQIDAQQALEIGIVNKLVSPAEIESETQKLATRLASGPRQAYGRIKRLINQSSNNDLKNQLDAEGEAFREGFQQNEFVEGVSAFIEKRKPSFPK